MKRQEPKKNVGDKAIPEWGPTAGGNAKRRFGKPFVVDAGSSLMELALRNAMREGVMPSGNIPSGKKCKGPQQG
jgi:hypothetical protein